MPSSVLCSNPRLVYVRLCGRAEGGQAWILDDNPQEPWIKNYLDFLAVKSSCLLSTPIDSMLSEVYKR